jgi:catechol 2,3-dioxygenase-like lactoylglutathione lyase family enzyme
MSNHENTLNAVQLAFNSCDLAGSLRLYAELGFHNAGGHAIWGQVMSIQGLPPSSRGFMWWLIGRQARVQLELFHLTQPAQRPQPADWRACDLGWTRFGIAVPDLEATKATLARWEIAIVELSEAGRSRRLAFRDPFIGCFVEVFEDHAAIPGGSALRHHDLDPAIVYATSSVSDLAAARVFYEDVLQLEISDEIVIHGPQHEILWGLAGARSESFVVKAGGFLLEIVQYLDPVARPRPDSNVADQGLLNVAFASHDRTVVEAALDRTRRAGCRTAETMVLGDACGAYVLEPEREIELCSLPAHLEAAIGYAPASPFFGQLF